MIEWDLNKSKQITFKQFVKKFSGKKFYIKNKDVKLEFLLKKDESLFNEKNLRMDDYVLQTIEEGEGGFFIISILFKDFLHIKNQKKVYSIYISNISKRDGVITGTQSIEMAINIAKHIEGIEYLCLKDAAKVSCKDTGKRYDLSLFKLLMKNETFYNKFGFKLWFESKDVQKILEKYAGIVGKFKVSNILKDIRSIIKALSNKNLKLPIKYKNVRGNNVFELNINDYSTIDDILCTYSSIERFFNAFKSKTIKKVVEYLYKKNCDRLQYMIYNLFEYSMYFSGVLSYKIQRKIYKNRFAEKLIKLRTLRENVSWQGYYVKKL